MEIYDVEIEEVPYWEEFGFEEGATYINIHFTLTAPKYFHKKLFNKGTLCAVVKEEDNLLMKRYILTLGELEKVYKSCLDDYELKSFIDWSKELLDKYYNDSI